MRILFMGTPEFAVEQLRRLVEKGHEICGVFTQPDKPRNRGMKMTFSPVKEYALTRDLAVYQPVKMRDGSAQALVQELQPELIVVAAYGRILPEDILAAAPLGAINVHSSVLPKYRGAAPINWAILDGLKETGVTIMYMAKELAQRLALLGADALEEAIGQIADGTVKRTPQDHSAFTYAPMLSKELSPMDWTRSAQALHDQVRGLIPWPCASMELAGKKVKVFKTKPGGETAAEAGTILTAGKQGLEIACGDGRSLWITELQAEGGKRMAAADYLRGHPVEVGK